ncbi:SDR family oxidoreductase [Halobacillus shinanisalinarum]|uniref:SDR family oxidoreductase n=1 Tax=Halobacillus shinanisalinarum TaxID=2932258 RepID=A0ABY4H117_9BACI|nr:SDR family oxidoreductase [Halobacillus shinanisalinarum]UOQ93876.1 SDR family oxidoreductase [Halobacillus shinanisalinarum]
MNILVTGFNGKVGFEVAQKLKEKAIPIKCAVRNVEKAKLDYGDAYEFVRLDFSDSSTFDTALNQIDKIFLIYPPGDKIEFERFLHQAKQKGIKHIVYLSVKDVQFLPFIHHFKNEKLLKRLGVPYTFIRAGYFMQNLNDFLGDEIKERQRIFIPAGKGKTSFVDTRDLAEVAMIALQDTENHQNNKYVITGDEALDFYRVADIMTEVLHVNIEYTNPSVKEFKGFMLEKGVKEEFINVVIGIHFPTKLGLAKGITYDYEKITNKKPTEIKTYIKDYKGNWM